MCHGDREAARVLARIVGAIVEHGEAEVTEALSRALSRQRCDLLELPISFWAKNASTTTIRIGKAALLKNRLIMGSRADGSAV